MATLRSAQVELGPAWQGPSSIGIASIGYSFGQQVAFFGAANGGGWVAIGSGITSNSSTNQVTGGTFTRVEYYRALKPIQSYDEVKKRTILSDIDYAQQDYCIGIELAEAMPLSTLRGKLSAGLQTILSGSDVIAGDGYIKPADFGIFGYGGDDTISPYKAKLASGGDGNDFFDSNPKQRSVLIGGTGNDRFDGSSGSDPGDAYYWIGGPGVNRYELPNTSTVIIIDRKTIAGQADIVLYGSVLLAESSKTKIIINSAGADPTKLAMRWVNADINEIGVANGKAKLTRLAQGGYISVTLDGIEQVKISAADGMDESEYEKKRAIIANKIGIADVSTLINTQGFSETILSQVKSELGLSTLAYAGPDLTKTIASHGSVVSTSFAVNSIAQENGVLTLKFNRPVGSSGTLYILESKSDGSLIGNTSLTVSDVKKSGDTVTAKLNTFATGNEKLNYMLWFVSGWTSSQGEVLMGQGSPLAVASDAYGFSYQKDIIPPELLSSEVIDGKLIRLAFSEPVAINNNQLTYVSTIPNPTSSSDVLISSQNYRVDGNRVEITLPTAIDGDYYLSFGGINDLSGNYFRTNSLTKLAFIDPVVSANRIKLDRSDKNSSTFLLPLKFANGMGSNPVERIAFNWKGDGSGSSGESFWQTFQGVSIAGYQSLVGSINCNAFTADGIHRLYQINIQFKNGGSIVYNNASEVNDFLAKSGLKQGSLDVVVTGKPATAALAINSIITNASEWDPNDAKQAVYADIAYSYSSSLPELNGSGRLDSLSLKYKQIAGGEALYLRGDALVVHPGKASFLFKPESNVSIKAGDYELE